ncbi:MAG: DUF1223 domain-containing protein [Bacteroidota bacterium]
MEVRLLSCAHQPFRIIWKVFLLVFVVMATVTYQKYLVDRTMKVVIIIVLISLSSLVNAQDGIAVVELFTSQGCSSCPSADRLLTKLMEEAESEGKTLFPLSFHVSYWNYLGWIDPYSSDDFTNRQRLYSSRLKTSNIYTPQMVVNGKHEFVGSNRALAKTSIDEVYNDEPLVGLELTEVDRSEDQVKYNFNWDGPLGGYVLNVALVERDIENYVPRGENRGRTLHHDNVVRFFTTYNSAKSGSVTVDLPGDAILENCSVVLYAQGKQNREVVGATAKAL